MKTICDYTIYCTPEQTRKALELGAPIDNCPIMFAPEGIPKYERQLRDGRWIAFPCPTAEQMIGWLEEQGFYFYIMKDFNWYAEVQYHNNWYFSEEGLGSRKEAVLAAIDAALDYLSKKGE